LELTGAQSASGAQQIPSAPLSIPP